MTARIRMIAAAVSAAAALSIGGTAFAQQVYVGPGHGYYSYGYVGPGQPFYRGDYYRPDYNDRAWGGYERFSRPGRPNYGDAVNRGQPGCTASVGWGNC